MKQDRPWFPFYAGDWATNQKLRRCPHELKGVWIDIMCLMHESEEYGVLRWPLDEIATAVGARRRQLDDLAGRGILKGASAGSTCERLVFVPVHARKRGPEVVLIDAQPGPIWFSSRMVEDEHKRLVKQNLPSPDHSPNRPNGERDAPYQSPPLVKAESAPNLSPLMRAGETEDRGQKEPNPADAGLSPAPSSVPPDPPPLALVPSPPLMAPPCPHQAIIDAYHRLLPTLPRVREWSETRRTHLAARWKARPKRQAIDWWERLFVFVAESPFLTGHQPGRDGQPPFQLTLPWLVKSEENLVKVIEGNYHRESA